MRSEERTWWDETRPHHARIRKSQSSNVEATHSLVMAFRKRNIGIGRAPQPPRSEGYGIDPTAVSTSSSGTRPSPIDGRLTTSTGTASLDSITGHAGLPVGHSILIQESGTTDYGGVLLKYFAAEGLAQSQKILVVGLGEQWGRELPGIVAAEADDGTKLIVNAKDSEKMKIAWRYESLGEFGTSRRGVLIHSLHEIISLDLHDGML